MIFTSLAQDSNFQNFKKLSTPEKCWVIWHPFVAKKAYRITKTARKATFKVEKDSVLVGTGNGDQVDAFRHAYWMAVLTSAIGERRSKKLGKAHEKGNYKDYKKRRKEDGVIPDKVSSEMDLYNNLIGIEIGKVTEITELKKVVIDAVKNGKCKIIKINSLGNNLDCEENVIPVENLKGKWENEKCLVDSNLI